jgi:hypothetical protein
VDWDSFLAVEFWALVTMASTLSAALSTAVTLLVRWRGRPEVEWAVVPLGGYGRPYKQGDPYSLTGEALNVGDGYAFRVAARGEHCKASLQSKPLPSPLGSRRFSVSLIPIVEPGQECPLEVQCALDKWDRAEVVIEWTESPTRRRKRRREVIPLREIRPAPQPEVNE